MAKKKRYLIVLIGIMLLLWTQPAMAAEPFSVTADKSAVQNGETFTVTSVFYNPEGAALKNLKLTAILPEGLYAKTTETTFETVASGESVTWELPISVGKDTALLPGSTTGGNPKTGNDSSPIVAAGIVVAALLVGAAVSMKDRKKSAKILSLFLVAVISTQSLTGYRVSAAEEPITEEQQTEVLVNGQKTPIIIRAEIEEAIPTSDADIEWRELTTADTVATGARFFTVVLNSQADFSDKLSPEMITTSGAFENTAIESVERLDNHSVKIRFDAIGQTEDTTAGILAFDASAFADQKAPGYAVVDVSTPVPYFDAGVSEVNFNTDGSVTLAFCIDTAEFSNTPEPEHFTFNKEGVTAKNIIVPSTESRRDGVVTITFDGEPDRSEQVEILRNLTMTIHEEALNSHALDLTLELEESPVAVNAWIESVDTDADGMINVMYGGQVIPETGSVNLQNSGTMPMVTSPDFPDAVCEEVLSTGSDTFRITAVIKPQSGITAEELATNWLYSQKLVLPDGVVTDIYGQPVKEDTYDIGAVSQTNRMALNADDTSVAYDCTSQILSGIKEMAQGDILGGILGIFGIGSTILDPTFEKLNAIKEDLNTLNQKTDAINQSIQTLSVQMQETLKNMQDQEKRKTISAFGASVDKLAWTVNKVNSADGGMIVRAIEAGEDSEVYQEMAQKVCDITASSEGGGDSFARDTLALGKMIIGDGTTETDSVFDLYSGLIEERYNWMTEAKADKTTFMTYGLNVYLKAYMLSMCYMQSNNADHRYDAAITQLVEQMKQVSDKEQAIMTASTPEDGKNSCLIDGKTYNLDGFIYPMPIYDWVYQQAGNHNFSETRAFYEIRDMVRNMIDRYCTPFISETTYNEMIKRLKASGAANLYDEMQAAGFKLPSEKMYLYSLTTNQKTLRDNGIRGGLKELGVYMDYYDLKQNKVVKNEQTARLGLEIGQGFPGRRSARLTVIDPAGKVANVAAAAR